MHRRSALCVAVAVGALVLAGCDRSADLPRNTLIADGMRIELGVVAAEDIRDHVTDPKDPEALHGGAAAFTQSHHVVVALFDARTGERITNARIRAGVGAGSYDHGPNTPLERMEVNGTVTYGGFFYMPETEISRIHLEIERPGVSRASEVEFAYEHPAGP